MHSKRSTAVTTIAAVATPIGRGGIGIVRLSGPKAFQISEMVTHRKISPRKATFCTFQHPDGTAIDEGIALLFKAPHSFTGEDVVELQGHGGVAVLQQVLEAVCAAGAVMALPGEFSERGFLNGKMDLVQAEAVADLIDASSNQAAQGALRSLQGEFSKKILELNQCVIRIRVLLESALDFSDEEIPLVETQQVKDQLDELVLRTEKIIAMAQQGARLHQGLSVVILGRPNAGKSSLLNCLAQKETAIVTDIAGTTRDVLQESIHIQGMPLHIIDTAGLRETDDVIEREGVRRAWLQAQQADCIVWVLDISDHLLSPKDLMEQYAVIQKNRSPATPVVIILNKEDLEQTMLLPESLQHLPHFKVSAKYQQGIEEFKKYLLSVAGVQCNEGGTFSARTRHIHALQHALTKMSHAIEILQQTQAFELVAEELKMSQRALGEITGHVTSDDLLGEIFSTFCIGK